MVTLSINAPLKDLDSNIQIHPMPNKSVAKFFGTNGIRGIFSEDLTLEFIHDMTLAIATHFKKGPVLVGYDGRKSSPVISKIVCSALNFAGLDCDNAGLVPTPCLEYAVKSDDHVGGIMITASHNPPQYNGIKPVAGDGVEISREDELVIEDIFLQKRWITNPTKAGITRQYDGAVPSYIKAIISHVDSEKIRSKNFKIVLDLGNGAQAVSASELSEALGCKTTLVNAKIDGMFPGRGSEPTPQNLSDLSNAVLRNGADLGVAFDGDGDRSLFCDNRGAILTGDKSALLLSRHLMLKNPESHIVTCINSGSGIESLADQHGAKIIRTKVGSVAVSRRMVSEGALIGFEENGGFMFGRHNHVRDGAMTMALMLDLLADSRKTLSDLASDLPKSFTTKDNIPCDPEQSARLIEFLIREFPDADTTDGIKISIDPKSWVMIRPSGTEPIVRIYAESQTQDGLDSMMAEFMQKAKSIISG